MFRTTIFAAAALAFAAVPAVAQGKQDFRLTNATGYDIADVYVAPTSSDDWEEDVMGEDTLDNGESVNIHFAPKDKQCLYDVRVVWTDGDEADWRKFDLCTVSHITLYWNNGKATAEYE